MGFYHRQDDKNGDEKEEEFENGNENCEDNILPKQKIKFEIEKEFRPKFIDFQIILNEEDFTVLEQRKEVINRVFRFNELASPSSISTVLLTQKKIIVGE